MWIRPRVVVAWLLLSVAGFTVSPCAAQSLSWSADFHGGDGLPESEPVGVSGLAVDGAGNTYALSLANNGTQVGLLVKYSAVGYQSWNRIERDGWPLAVTLDERGWPRVLTPYRTLAYDGDGNVRWRADHVFARRWVAAAAMASAPGSHVFVAGVTESAAGDGRSQVGIMRLDESGRALWLQSLDAPNGTLLSVDALGVDRSGRVYIGGRSQDAAVNTVSSFVMALAGDGSPLWSRWAPGGDPSYPAVMAVDPNGGAFLSVPGGPLVSFSTVRFDAGGVPRWSVDISDPGRGFGRPLFAAAGEDGGVFLQGFSSEQAVIARLDASGAQRWMVARFGAPGGLAVDPAGRAITAWSEPSGAMALIAYEATGGVAWSNEWSAEKDAPGGLLAAGVIVSASGHGRAQALGWRSWGGLHLVEAFGPSGYSEWPDWPILGQPRQVPSADWARSARFDAEGNALVLATGFDAGYRDRILKYDRAGRLLWSQEPFAGSDVPCRVLAVAVGPSGESVAVGQSSSFALPRIARLDASGSRTWLRTDVLPAQYREGGATATVVDSEGAVYVAGWAWDMDSPGTPSRLFLGKYSPDGQVLWLRFDAWPTAYTYWPVLATVAPGGRVVVGGTVWQPEQGFSSPRIWVVDGSGADVWAASPGDPWAGETITALVADSAGAVYAGTIYPGRVYKLGAAGALEWTRSAPDGVQWDVNALSVDADRELTIAYWAPCLLERVLATGERLWWKYPEYPAGPSSCLSLAPRPAGGFFVAGRYLDGPDRSAHGYVSAYDALGHADWSRDSGAPGDGPSALAFLAADPSGRVLTAGYAYREATDYDALVQVTTDEPRIPLSFYTVPPCRALDTRDPSLGGPLPLDANAHTEVSLVGRCGVPASARAVALNLTAVAPWSAGHVTAFPAGQVAPLASVLNFAPGLTRASQATLDLGDGGKLALRPMQDRGSVHLIIDVTGYFE